MKSVIYILCLLTFSKLSEAQKINEYGIASDKEFPKAIIQENLRKDHVYIFEDGVNKIELAFFDNGEYSFKWIGNSDHIIDGIAGTYKTENDTIWLKNHKPGSTRAYFSDFSLHSIEIFKDEHNYRSVIFKSDIHDFEIEQASLSVKKKRKIAWSKPIFFQGKTTIYLVGNNKLKIDNIWAKYNTGLHAYISGLAILQNQILYTSESLLLRIWDKGNFLKIQDNNLAYFKWNPKERKYIQQGLFEYVKK